MKMREGLLKKLNFNAVNRLDSCRLSFDNVTCYGCDAFRSGLRPTKLSATAKTTMLGRRSLRQLNTTLRSLTRSASSSTPAVKINEVAVEAVKKEPVTLQQAPNHPTTWSTSQRPRPGPGSGPRFEQTAMDLQPNPLSAMDMIAQEPIRLVHGRKAVCDGGTSSFSANKFFFDCSAVLLCGSSRRGCLRLAN